MTETMLEFSNFATQINEKTPSTRPRYPKYAWNTNTKYHFQNCLLSPILSDKIGEFMISKLSEDEQGVNESVGKVTQILQEAANQCTRLKFPGRNTKANTKKRDAWFDTQCLAAKRNLRGFERRVKKDPYNRTLRNDYLQECYRYKKTY
jgi:hypothetical protein